MPKDGLLPLGLGVQDTAPYDVSLPTTTASATVRVHPGQQTWTLVSLRSPKHPGLPWIEDPWHAQLRPFDRALREHRPQQGSVRYVALDTGASQIPRLLAAIADTPNGPNGQRYLDGRLHILPGWGKMPVRRLNRGPEPEPHPVHHVTLEEDGKGTLRAHLSAPRSNGKKPWIVETTALAERTRTGANVLTLLIRDPGKLDPAGNAWTYVPSPRRKPAAGLQRELRASMVSDHPMMEMPFGEPWRSGNHLQVNFVLTQGRLRNEPYPISTVRNPAAFSDAPPEGKLSKRRMTRMPLFNGRSLVVTVEQTRGVPSNDAVVLFRRLHRRSRES